MRKSIILPLLIVAIAGMTGCYIANDEIRTNDFIKNNPKPIIVRYGKFNADGVYRPMTLQSANGKILSIEYSQINLPDTIK